MEPCPLPETLGAYLEHRVAESEIEAHLAACPACRETVLHLSRLRVHPLSRLWIPAAAAALLLAVVALNWTPRSATVLPPAATPESPATVVLLGQASSAALKPGGRMELRSGLLHLLEGALWIEDPGEPLEIRLPGGALEILEARLLVEVLPPKRETAWIREARAEGAPEVRVWVESGAATLKLENGERKPFGPGGEAPSWRGEGRWRPAPSLPARVRDGCWALKEDASVWEAVLRRLDPSASVGVRFRSGGKLWEVPLGRVLLEAPGRLRVRVETAGGKVRIRAGSYETFAGAATDLVKRLEPVQGEPGLRAWGGEVEIVEARAR